ncbi:MAG: hypothetical protein HY783_09000 [Chloroflexi bacterium]|nr:hypothetical protein [Chloroflexota bacterium]
MKTFWRRGRGSGEARGSSFYCTALDVGTEFAKALVCEIKNGQGHILGVGRQRQTEHEMQEGRVTDIDAVVANCDVALRQAEDMTEEICGRKVVPDQTVIGIAGEFVKGAAYTVQCQRPKATSPLAVGELEGIVRRAERLALSQVRQQLSWETGTPDAAISLVNAAIVEVVIDGYRVVNPLRFQGKNLQVTVFNAFAPLVHIGALRTVAAELELELLAVVAEPYAVARCLGTGDAIFVDVGGGTTDIALVRNGGIQSTRSYALGGRAFTKRLALALGLPYQRAEELKLDYARGKLEKARAADVKKALAPEVTTWLDGVELILEEMAGNEPLPPRFYLCGGGSALPEIVECLRAHPWHKKLPFSRYPDVNVIKPQEVVGLLDRTRLLVSQQDITPMALAYQAANMDRDTSIQEQVLRRVIKAMKI